jgi:ketosteroid isomerase-like protein
MRPHPEECSADESNAAIVRRFYATHDAALLAEDVAWHLAPGFPAGGRYDGRRAVLEEWWPKRAALFGTWRAIPDRLLDAGEAIVALGRYEGAALATGEWVSVPFAHVWWMREGRIAGLTQHTDTLLIDRALASPEPAFG